MGTGPGAGRGPSPSQVLGLVPADLAGVVGTEAARTEPVRAFARVARRRCRGEEWRAFLAGRVSRPGRGRAGLG